MSGAENGQTRPSRFVRRLLRMVRLAAFALSLAAVFVVLFGLQTDTDQGQALIARRDYVAARAAFERAARGGSARALWWLGRMAEEGLGATPDPDKALDFYLRAAHRNNLQAQRRVAELLSAPRDAVPGSPTPADLAQAARWYATAGHRGDNESRYRMGLCLRNGAGVPRDTDAALGWFTRAGGRGHARAMVEAASIHLARAGHDPDHLWRARDWLLRAAEAGDMEAMYRLGELHRDGTLADETGKKAWEWFTRAAEAGYPPAQYLMARRLDAGDGVPAFPLEAARWYRLAAEQGQVDSMLRLADLYFRGRGVFRDRPEARRWRDAAGEADASARAGLCRLYAAGEPEARDLSKAARWCRRAAEDGDAFSRYLYGLLLARGLGAPRDELGSAKWLAAAAGQGMAEAQYALSLLYLGGRGVIRDAAQAFAWCRKAAEQGLPEAQTLLASMYDEELRSSRNYAQALRWYRRAAGAGEVTAQFNLGSMFGKGIGVPTDPVQSLEWFTRAAQAGDPRAAFNVGLMHLTGTGTPKDEQRALEWFLRAAKAGDARSRQSAALMYQLGQGTPQAPREAFRLARMAAHQGLPQAQAMLGAAYFEGRIVARDLPESLFWLNLATREPSTEYPWEKALAAKARVEKRLSAEQLAQVRERVAAWKPRPADISRENDGLAAVRFLESPDAKRAQAGQAPSETSDVYVLF